MLGMYHGSIAVVLSRNVTDRVSRTSYGFPSFE
jgi:hypothetical protein